MATTYTKLRDGSWGLRVEGPVPQVGSAVTVTKKSGETKVEKIGKVLWTGNGMALCSIEQNDSASNGHAAPRRGRSCSCDGDCCRNGCRCDSHCNCRGGNIYDC